MDENCICILEKLYESLLQVSTILIKETVIHLWENTFEQKIKILSDASLSLMQYILSPHTQDITIFHYDVVKVYNMFLKLCKAKISLKSELYF